jgi:hypothetical protein
LEDFGGPQKIFGNPKKDREPNLRTTGPCIFSKFLPHPVCTPVLKNLFFIYQTFKILNQSHQDGQVGTEQVGEEDGGDDDGVADDDSLSQELVVARTEKERVAILTDPGQ